MKNIRWGVPLCLLAAIPAFHCAAPQSTATAEGDGDDSATIVDENNAATGGATIVTGGGGTSSGGSSTSSGGTQTGTGGSTVQPIKFELPFALDTYFAPSGFMGDVTFITMTSDCADRRPVGSLGLGGESNTTGEDEPQGNCHVIDYAYNPTTPAGWAAVKWQSPSNNWGAQPGLAVPPGATQVNFWAKGDTGGEIVDFSVGGINTDGAAGPGMDTMAVQIQVTLTTEWTFYTINITGAVYTEVVGGFGWATSGAANGGVPVGFSVDDVRWQ